MVLSRRDLLLAAGATAVSPPLGGLNFGPRANPVPTPAQKAWHEAELGVVFHWDLHVFDGKRYVQSQNRINPITDPNLFNPTKYDIDQWFESVKGMGARFAILTSCHETGFRLWQSDANPYCMKAIDWRGGRGDIVKDFVEACHRHDVKPGIYFGARWNSHLDFFNFRPREGATMTQAEYNRLIEAEILELCTRYGEIFEIWFDGGILAPNEGGPDVLPIFEKHQPDCLFYHSNQRRDARWGGSESGTVPYPCWANWNHERYQTGNEPPDALQVLARGVEDGRSWCPAMSDAPLRGANGRHEWFWEPDDENAVYPLESLVRMYERSVGHNSTLIMGLTPDPDGLMPEVDTQRCIEWGQAIQQKYGSPLATTEFVGRAGRLDLPRPTKIDRVIIQERIGLGHRVHEYDLFGLVPGQGWRQIGEGSAIGHKRIQIFDPVTVQALRLSVTRSVDTPVITNFSAFEATN